MSATGSTGWRVDNVYTARYRWDIDVWTWASPRSKPWQPLQPPRGHEPSGRAVAHKDVSAKTRRNMPDPIPVMVRARLAVDSAYQKQGLGSALLKDALLRTIAAAPIAGIRAVLLHAMSDDAKRFHVRAGFHECPVDPMMMMITLAEVEKNLSPPSAS